MELCDRKLQPNIFEMIKFKFQVTDMDLHEIMKRKGKVNCSSRKYWDVYYSMTVIFNYYGFRTYTKKFFITNRMRKMGSEIVKFLDKIVIFDDVRDKVCTGEILKLDFHEPEDLHVAPVRENFMKSDPFGYFKEWQAEEKKVEKSYKLVDRFKFGKLVEYEVLVSGTIKDETIFNVKSITEDKMPRFADDFFNPGYKVGEPNVKELYKKKLDSCKVSTNKNVSEERMKVYKLKNKKLVKLKKSYKEEVEKTRESFENSIVEAPKPKIVDIYKKHLETKMRSINKIIADSNTDQLENYDKRILKKFDRLWNNGHYVELNKYLKFFQKLLDEADRGFMEKFLWLVPSRNWLHYDDEGKILCHLPDLSMFEVDEIKKHYINYIGNHLRKELGNNPKNDYIKNLIEISNKGESEIEESKTYYHIAKDQIPYYLLKKSANKRQFIYMLKNMDSTQMEIVRNCINVAHKYDIDKRFLHEVFLKEYQGIPLYMRLKKNHDLRIKLNR